MAKRRDPAAKAAFNIIGNRNRVTRSNTKQREKSLKREQAATKRLRKAEAARGKAKKGSAAYKKASREAKLARRIIARAQGNVKGLSKALREGGSDRFRSNTKDAARKKGKERKKSSSKGKKTSNTSKRSKTRSSKGKAKKGRKKK